MSVAGSNGIVIVGAGQAGYELAVGLRDTGFEGPIKLVGAERGLPYQRPPLSKDIISSSENERSLDITSESALAELRIDLLDGCVVSVLERPERRLRLASGLRLSYDHLILATGARNRKLPCAAGVKQAISLRTREDALQLREMLSRAER